MISKVVMLGKGKILFPVIILCISFASGCSIRSSPIISEDQNYPYQTKTNNPNLKETATPFIMDSEISTQTPIPTTPSPTLERINTIEYEFVPTLPPQDALELVDNLYSSLRRCDKPCWGEIIPGVTSIQEVHNILGSISEPQYLSEDSFFIDDQGNQFLYSSETWRRDFGDQYVEWFIQAENHIVTELHFHIDSLTDSMSHFLTAYGKPDEMWVLGWIPPFDEEIILLGLYYRSDRTFFWYIFNGYIQNGNQKACGVKFHQMYVWSESHKASAFGDLYKAFFGGDNPGFREIYNLEMTTDWTLKSFYEEIRVKSDPEVCISIPLEQR